MTVNDPEAVTSIGSTAPDGDLDGLDDGLLVARTRAGDSAAFAVLWRRYADMATRVARRFTSSVDPDDLVAEAFTRVYLAIRNGGGPSNGFRPYLLTTLRNTARTWGSRSHEVPTDRIDDLAASGNSDPILVGLANRELLRNTFAALPSRWKQVLWWSEVEGRTPAEIASLTDLSENAASALCYRAREGMRQAWIQTQLPIDGAERASAECRWAQPRIGSHVRHALRPHQATRMRAHLDECSHCSAIAVSGTTIASALGIVLAVAGSGGFALAALLGSSAGRSGHHAVGLAKPKMLAVVSATGGVVAAVAIVAVALHGGAAPVEARAGTAPGAPPVAALTRPVPSPSPSTSTRPSPKPSETRRPGIAPSVVPTPRRRTVTRAHHAHDERPSPAPIPTPTPTPTPSPSDPPVSSPTGTPTPWHWPPGHWPPGQITPEPSPGVPIPTVIPTPR